MKAKIIKKIPKIIGLRPNETYQVHKIADDKEGVWLVDDNKNNVFVEYSKVELYQEDGVTKFQNGSIVVSFLGLLPKTVNYDPKSLQMTVIW